MSDYRLDKQEQAAFDLARAVAALEEIDRRGKELTEQVRAVVAELEAANKFLRETHVMLVRDARMPNNIPLIGEK
jgi:hypothetical protein